ncbi:MAG TPA: glycosyltransferase [Verrucomicrobiae bacterium]|nr:glycosyltransferase [Verrucomicrobiae bacterium]
MNILMMSNTYFPITGGLEKSIQSFARQFRKMGHKVLIAAPEYPGVSKKEYGVARIPAIQNFKGTDFSVNLPIPGIVEKFIEVFRPDIIHAHHPFFMGDMAMRVAGQYNIPLVFTYHIMFEQYTDYFPLNSETGKNFVIELATGYANLCDHVIVPSESVREMLIERKVKTPVWVVPTGVDTKAFRKGDRAGMRRRLKIPKDAFTAGYTGRVSPEKNLEYLGRAVSLFLKRQKNARFLVVGKGSYSEPLEKLFRGQGVLDRVHFAGVLRGRKLVDAYHAMDAFAFASQSETQGMVVTEAMAAGLPVAALDGPGVREVVKNRANGRLLPAGARPESFVKALEGLMREKDESMRAAALATAESFSMENCALKALHAYQSVKTRRRFSKRIHRPWETVMNRIKTEWEMLANLGKAAGTALAEAAAAPLHVPAGAAKRKKGKAPAGKSTLVRTQEMDEASVLA